MDFGEIGGGIIGAIGNVIGANIQSKSAKDTAAFNAYMQQMFAQNSIQWKVQDAIKAGINPLAALGASTSSFSNVVGDDGAMGKGISAAAGKLGDAAAGALKEDDPEVKVATGLKLENAKLQNDYLRAQIARISNPGVGP